MHAGNNRPRPVQSSASDDGQRQANLRPQRASIARATSVHASRWESRVRGGHGAMETCEQRRRKRDAHVTPFAQSDVDAKGPNPTTPPARMRQVTILAGALGQRLDPTLSSALLENPVNPQLISHEPLLHTGLPIGGPRRACLRASNTP